MEHQANREASVVLKKGSKADKVRMEVPIGASVEIDMAWVIHGDGTINIYMNNNVLPFECGVTRRR